MTRKIIYLLVISSSLGISCSKQRYTDPLPLLEALESFQLQKGFKIEVFASEPYVYDPVSMVFDEQGNSYVVEMPSYPTKPGPEKPGGRIRLLQDTDGDGRIDKTILFADSLMEATSILPWKGGLIVTAAPHILYLKDTDGDFKADTKEILFSGFFDNNPEAQVTSLRFGIDNWIYASNNGQPGKVIFERNPEAPPLSMGQSDFRFRLDRGQFELAAGISQFGQSLNDWGHRLLTSHSDHIRQPVIPARYLSRHRHLTSKMSLENISDHETHIYQLTPAPYWRFERTKRRNQRFKDQNLDRTEYAQGHFSGASGGTIYAGDAFPEEYYGNVFTGDVAGNIVHRDIITTKRNSPILVAKRGLSEHESEFLASTDPWFRPVNFTSGPDGYLYVIDMYRQHIETPIAIPEDLKTDMDFFNGNAHGRIYRILPENSESHKKQSPDLNEIKGLQKRASYEYVELLTHPNRWWRLQAQRLLLERQDYAVIPKVKTLFATQKDPRARLHALYVLEGLNALNVELVKQAMKDNHPGVREHGIILSEKFPELLPQIMESIKDPYARVVFQATLSLGEFSDKRVVTVLAKIVQQYGEDKWFRIAVLSSEPGSSFELMQVLADPPYHIFSPETKHFTTGRGVLWVKRFLEDFFYVVGSRNRQEQLNAFLDLLSQQGTQKESELLKAAFTGLMKGLKKNESSDADLTELLSAIENEPVEEAIQALRNLYSGSLQ